MKTCNHVYKQKREKQYTNIDDLNIFNILIFDGKYDPTNRLKLHIDSFKLQYPNMKHHLLLKDEVREIISSNFDNDVLNAFDKLKPYAYKTDLARLCVLYKFGGIYSDVSHIHLSPIKVKNDTRILFFRDHNQHPPFSISPAVIFSRQGQKEILDIIDLIVNHTKNNFYGSNPLDITGNYAWGRYLASLENLDGIHFGDTVQTTHGKPAPRMLDISAYFTISKYMPDGRLICIRNKSNDSSVNEFLKGGNSYAQMWNDKEVYSQ